MSAIATVSQKDLLVPRMSAIKVVLTWMGVTLLAFPSPGTWVGASVATSTLSGRP